ncbi:hypothetical protein Scep_013364 [Stephania cephalantha]|uniref:Uncharacterized protein n=1 Tax=Stephania cephalantha TaxID=152367 RepID=A0AAP0JGZ3_9MAGN
MVVHGDARARAAGARREPAARTNDVNQRRDEGSGRRGRRRLRQKVADGSGATMAKRAAAREDRTRGSGEEWTRPRLKRMFCSRTISGRAWSWWSRRSARRPAAGVASGNAAVRSALRGGAMVRRFAAMTR